MAGFFHLSGRELGGATTTTTTTTSSSSKQEDQEKEEENHHNHNNPFLYRSNEEIYHNKGFEIWPQSYYYQYQNTSGNSYAPFGVVGASRRSSFSMSDDSSSRSGFQVMRQSGGGGAGGGINCQDCGNQAKKDCAHLRCRTCCKSRGFQCQTHVKSTWVPAAKRRERQQQLSSLQQQQQHQEQHQQQQQFRGDNPKRLRENHQSLIACTNTSRLAAGTSGLEVGHFPQELNSPALFRCVRVSAMDDADEHLAYQTAVNIGGHVFRGILYDQGPDARYSGPGESSSGGSQQGNFLTAVSTSAATSAAAGALIDPSSLYPPPLHAFVAGTQFFPPPRP